MDALFGAEVPLAIKFVVAALVVIGLAAAVFWLLRRFGPDRLNAQGLRSRQPRLAVIDAATVDGRRRLVLIRRDNVEHLMMIGGPTDVVIEQNIVRASAPARDAAPGRPADVTRPAQLEDATSWPLQPDPGPRSRPAEETPQWIAPAEPTRPRASDALAGLAADLSASRPMPQSSLARAAPAEPARNVTPPLGAPAEAPAPSAADQNLAEMAFRLEAALRRPGVGTAAELRSGAKPPPEIMGGPAGPNKPPAPSSPEAKPPQAKSPYGSLEQEMASLLSRPPGKT